MPDLPDRRPSNTVRLEHKGHTHFVGLGFDPISLRVLEVFLKGPQVGSDLEALTNRCCILASLLMQRADLTPREVLDLVNLNTDLLTGTNEPDLLIAVLQKAADVDEERLGFPREAAS